MKIKTQYYMLPRYLVKLEMASNGLTISYSPKAAPKDIIFIKGPGIVCLSLWWVSVPPCQWNYSDRDHIPQGKPRNTFRCYRASPLLTEPGCSLCSWVVLQFVCSVPIPRLWAWWLIRGCVDLMRPGSGVVCSSIPTTFSGIPPVWIPPPSLSPSLTPQGEWGLC